MNRNSASLCALRTARAPGAISRDFPAAEHNPVAWPTRFGSHQPVQRLADEMLILQTFLSFRPGIYHRCQELLCYLKATNRSEARQQTHHATRGPSAAMELLSCTTAASTAPPLRNARLHFRNQCKHQLGTKNDHRLNAAAQSGLRRGSSDKLISPTG